MSISASQISEITAYINSYRAKHSSPPLVWNSDIATYSQNWSDYLLNIIWRKFKLF
jgi:uncharacterized protein YkwD